MNLHRTYRLISLVSFGGLLIIVAITAGSSFSVVPAPVELQGSIEAATINHNAAFLQQPTSSSTEIIQSSATSTASTTETSVLIE